MLKAMYRTCAGLIVIGAGCFLQFVPQPVMAQIAPGVTQSAAHTANITGTVTQGDGAPVAGADVKLNGPQPLSTKSDDHGTFDFRNVPWGTYQIIVTAAFGTASRNNVTVNGDISVAIQYQAQNGPKEIAHVSTSGAGAHINVTSSSITSITPSEYAFQNNSTWKDLLAQIPGVAVSGYARAGLNPIATVAGAPMTPVILSLNGALPYETSTTLDGMPLQGISPTTQVGGGADLSTLPMNAFDTADIVRGPGANAPSIVDSVGGSFVLHAPGQVTTDHFEFSASNDPFGGIVSNAKIALRLGHLSATLVYGLNDSPGPLGTGTVLGSLSEPVAINGQTVQSSTVGYNVDGCGIRNSYCSYTNTLLYCCLAQSTAWTAHNGAVDLSYNITPFITAEVFYAGTSERQNDQYGYWPVAFAPSAAIPAYSGSLASSQPGQTNYSILQISGGLTPEEQASSLIEEKLTAFMGRGVLRLAALQYNSFNSVSVANCDPPSGEYRVWGTADVGATSPGTSTAYNGTLENLTFPNEFETGNAWSNNRDLLGSYAIQVGSASSIGISYTTSYYNSPGGFEFYDDGAPLFSYGQTSAVSETTDETRIHFDTEVGNKLSLGLSWYFAEGSYHVPGLSPNSLTNLVFPYNAPRFGAVWQASHDIAVRASAGGGYALPALGNLTGSSLTCSPTVCNQTSPNFNLKPEETFGFDVGTDVRFHRNTVLSLDLYRTNLNGQFFTNTTESIFNGLPLFLQQFGNIATSLMQGINLDLHHDTLSGLYWGGTLGLTRGYVVSVPLGFYNNPSVPCTNCANQIVIPGANFTNAAYSATVPYASASLQIGYKWNPGKYIDVSPTYYGNNNIYNVPAFVEVDAHAGYPISKNVSLLATFRNITGIYDQSVVVYSPYYENPSIQDATGFWTPASYAIPYGPRTVLVTVNFKY